MKIAVPVFDTRIAPRFDCAQIFCLVNIENNRIIHKKEFLTIQSPSCEKIKKLIELGVDTLICGGIDNSSMRLLNVHPIKIFSWVTGDADDAIRALLRGKLEHCLMIGQGGCRNGKWKIQSASGQGRRGHDRGNGNGKRGIF